MPSQAQRPRRLPGERAAVGAAKVAIGGGLGVARPAGLDAAQGERRNDAARPEVKLCGGGERLGEAGKG